MKRKFAFPGGWPASFLTPAAGDQSASHLEATPSPHQPLGLCHHRRLQHLAHARGQERSRFSLFAGNEDDSITTSHDGIMYRRRTILSHLGFSSDQPLPSLLFNYIQAIQVCVCACVRARVCVWESEKQQSVGLWPSCNSTIFFFVNMSDIVGTAFSIILAVTRWVPYIKLPH